MTLGQELGLVLPTFAHAVVVKTLQRVEGEVSGQPAAFARGLKGEVKRGNCVSNRKSPPRSEVPPAELVRKGKRGAGSCWEASSHAFAPPGSGLGRGARSQLCSPLSLLLLLGRTMFNCPSGVPHRRGRAFPSSSPLSLCKGSYSFSFSAPGGCKQSRRDFS